MNNYVYIISSLPVISRDVRTAEGLDREGVMEEIRSQCSESDNALIDILTSGLDGKNLNEEFYRKAEASSCKFLKGYFKFDRNMRNCKARYLNEAFGRPLDMDCISLSEDEEDFEEAPRLDQILHSEDLLERERALDAFVWEHVDEMTTFNYFEFDCILAFIAKLSIVERWLKLDPQTGREMFRKLADEVVGTFKGIDFQA